MANNFQITISAVDHATAVAKKINEQIAQIVKPITDLQKASAALGRELGLPKMAKSLGDVAKAAGDVADKVTGIVASLSAVIGVGSIAGVAELAKRWGDLGSEVGRTTATIGDTADELQSLRGAAQLSGVSTEALTAGLKTLGDTMQDARFGRNQQALMLMNQLGITLKHTASGAVDTSAAFLDIADALSKVRNPQAQGLLARTFGLEEQLPLLRKGRAGIIALTDEMRRSGAMMSGSQIAAATAFQQSMVRLDLSMAGLKNTIGAALGPVMLPLIDDFSRWIAANRELIAQPVGEFARGLAQALRDIDWHEVVSDVKAFVQGIKDTVEWMGGWKHAAIAMAVVMNGSLIASVLNLVTAIGKLTFGAFPTIIRLIGVITQAWIPGLLARMAILTETALPALSEAFLGLGVAIEATPIGWIITAIAAVGFAGYELYKHWDDIKRWWHRLWGDMSDDAEGGSERIKGAVDGTANNFASPGDGTSEWDSPAENRNGVSAWDGAANSRVAEGDWDDDKAGGSSKPGTSNNPGLLGLIRKLENSGDSAISPAGAIGRYQIMPQTAKGYGYDPAKLMDPMYNQKVAETILGDLQNKYGGDTDAILTAYNAGPGRANKFIASGHNIATLPLETQKYLAHAHALAMQSGPSVPTPYAPYAHPSPLDAQAEALGITSTAPAGSAAAGGQSGTMAAPSTSGTVRVEVILQNAAPGTKVRTHTTGPLAVNTKIGYSMANSVV